MHAISKSAKNGVGFVLQWDWIGQILTHTKAHVDPEEVRGNKASSRLFVPFSILTLPSINNCCVSV